MVCLLLWKQSLIPKIVSKAALEFKFPAFPFRGWFIFLVSISEGPLCKQEKFAWMYRPLSAFGTIFRITGGFRNNFLCHRHLSESRNTGFMKTVSEIIFWISECFYRSKHKLCIESSLQKKQFKNFQDRCRSYRKCSLVFKTFEKIFISWGAPFNIFAIMQVHIR